MTESIILTYKYRIKDATSKVKLKKLASSVNYVWNYINNLSYQNIKLHGRFLSEYDIDYYLAGSSKEIGLLASSLQEISKVYVKSRKLSHKRKLSWRSSKRSLGWIPIKAEGIKFISDDTIRYNKLNLRFYKSRNLPDNASIKTAQIVQDSRDRWYICITFAIPKPLTHPSNKSIGIDLGIKNKITLSNGEVYSRDNITKQYEEQLAKAQRANKKKQIRNLHAKIANCRKDWTHKITSKIAKQFAFIYVGNLKSSEILTENNHINKSIYDAGIASIQNFLVYKASKLGGSAELVNEMFTTKTCNSCLLQTGPSGEKDLQIREWQCSCGALHDRDVNSAINILRIGHDTL